MLPAPRKTHGCAVSNSAPVDRSIGIFCDQVVVLEIAASRASYPDKLRRVRFTDPETGKRYTFLTNDFTLPAMSIAQLYKSRWQVELFFKWIEQHLRITAFYGRSPNAVKTQIWIAISVYVLVAIVRKRLAIDKDLHTLLQILSIGHFEKVPLQQALTGSLHTPDNAFIHNQLSLFNL